MKTRETEDDAEQEQQEQQEQHASRIEEDGGFITLVRRVVEQAQSDRSHRHNPRTGCGIACDVGESARQFLKDIRSGNAGLWSAWVDLASMSLRDGESRTRRDRRTLTDDHHEPDPLPPPKILPPAAPKKRRQTSEEYAKKKHLMTGRQAAEYVGFHYAVFMKHARVHPAERFRASYLYRRRDLDAYMKTSAYQRSVKWRDKMLARRPVTAEMIVQAGYALDARGVAEFTRLWRRVESKKIPAMAAG